MHTPSTVTARCPPRIMPKESAESVELVGQVPSKRQASCLPKMAAPDNNDTVSFPALVMSL